MRAKQNKMFLFAEAPYGRVKQKTKSLDVSWLHNCHQLLLLLNTGTSTKNFDYDMMNGSTFVLELFSQLQNQK